MNIVCANQKNGRRYVLGSFLQSGKKVGWLEGGGG